MDTRTQRVVIETSRFRIVGDVSLPTEGFRTRLSDVLNRQDTIFLTLINVEMTPVDGAKTESHAFVAVARDQILLAYEAESSRE
jgi:hypothetical protein